MASNTDIWDSLGTTDPKATRNPSIPEDQYQHLLDCRDSEQIPDSAWQEHLQDKGFREWVEAQTEPSKESEIKPCPFCGSSEIDLQGVTMEAADGCLLSGPACDECGGSFNITGDPKTDLRIWNTRTADSDTALIGELVEALKSANELIDKIVEAELYEELHDGLGRRTKFILEAICSYRDEIEAALTRARKRAGGA